MDSSKFLLPPLHIKLGLIKTLSKAWTSPNLPFSILGVPGGQVVRPPVHPGKGPGFEAPLRQGLFKPFLTLGLLKSESAPHSLLSLRAGELIWWLRETRPYAATYWWVNRKRQHQSLAYPSDHHTRVAAQPQQILGRMDTHLKHHNCINFFSALTFWFQQEITILHRVGYVARFFK